MIIIRENAQMKTTQKWGIVAITLTLTLGGCGLFGASNKAEGDWKVTGVSSNMHSGYGVGNDMASMAASKLDGEVYKITAHHMITPATANSPGESTVVQKYEQKGDQVTAYIHDHGKTVLIPLTISQNGKVMSMNVGPLTLTLHKIS